MRFLVFSVCLFLSLPAFAQSFFSGLPDIPLMAGLTELEERALSFDKAEGRILSAAAALDDSVSIDEVEHFYLQSLPQFGWKIGENGSFIRGGEVLKMEFAEEGSQIVLLIRISP